MKLRSEMEAVRRERDVLKQLMAQNQQAGNQQHQGRQQGQYQQPQGYSRRPGDAGLFGR